MSTPEHDAAPARDSRPGIEAFTFGEPESVLDHARILDYFQSLDVAGTLVRPGQRVPPA